MKIMFIMLWALFLTTGKVYAGEKCFSKNAQIENAVGAHLLEDKICFRSMSISMDGMIPVLHITDGTYSGSFDLIEITQPNSIRKFVAFIKEAPFEHLGFQMNATVRISVDVSQDLSEIDYLYLAAEFFTFFDDGGYDVRIYYFSRN